MNIVFPLIGISLAMALVFLGAFIWSVRSGQQEDLYTPSVRILFDESDNLENPANEKNKKDQGNCITE